MAGFVKKSDSVNDKVVLVTGGATGVGAAIVKVLLCEKAQHVAFLDNKGREGALLELKLRLKFGYWRPKFIKCDVSDKKQLFAAFKQVLDKHRRLDIVINAAILSPKLAGSCKQMIDINFTATENSTLKAIGVMGVDKGGAGGTVVNISPLLDLKTGSHLPLFTPTKTAVMHFGISMGAEERYNKTRVRILTVCLGPTDTAIPHRNSKNFDDALRASRMLEKKLACDILRVIGQGASGSTWIVEKDKPAHDFTGEIAQALQMLSTSQAAAKS